MWIALALALLFSGAGSSAAIRRGNAQAARRAQQAIDLKKEQMIMQFASYTDEQQRNVVKALKEARIAAAKQKLIAYTIAAIITGAILLWFHL